MFSRCWDWAPFPGLDGFFGDWWLLRDQQWGHLLVGIYFGFDWGLSLYVRPGSGKNWWWCLRSGASPGLARIGNVAGWDGNGQDWYGGNVGLGVLERRDRCLGCYIEQGLGTTSVLVGIGVWERNRGSILVGLDWHLRSRLGSIGVWPRRIGSGSLGVWERDWGSVLHRWEQDRDQYCWWFLLGRQSWRQGKLILLGVEVRIGIGVWRCWDPRRSAVLGVMVWRCCSRRCGLDRRQGSVSGWALGYGTGSASSSALGFGMERGLGLASSGLELGYGSALGCCGRLGVWVWLGVVVKRQGSAWRWGLLFGLASGFGVEVQLGIVVCSWGLARRQGLVSLGTLWFWWFCFVEHVSLGEQWIDNTIVVGWSRSVRLVLVLGEVWARYL